MRCGEIVAIDCDVLDEAAAEKIRKEALRCFGKAFPTRVGAPPKFLMMCRTAEPFSKLYTDKYVQPDGGESRVEVLANGQQFIAYGIHPKTGKPYEWFGGDPTTIGADDLPEVSRDQVVEFLRAAEGILSSQPDWTVAPKAARANYEGQEREEPKHDYSGQPTDWARLERALDALTDVSDYDTFYRIIAALKDGTDSPKFARALAFKWAAGYPDLFDPVGLQKKWDSFKRGGGAGLGTIFFLAQQTRDASGLEDLSHKALLLPSAEFVKDFSPPDYLVKGLLRRRFAYAISARTGDGKTAICLLLVACVDQGIPFAGHAIKRRGLCIYFAGENPDDIRMRWLAMTREMGRKPEDFNVRFVPGVYKLHEIKDRIRQEVGEEDVALVVIDTSAAYFPGTDENNNVELGNHARMLRTQFVDLPGGPCVTICCHPIKHAADDNLQPRGGGAYVAELDGNLTVLKQPGNEVAELHWQTKFRGPNFAPMTFKFKTVNDHPLLKDSDGDPLPTVVAVALSEQDKQYLTNRARKNQDTVLTAIHQHVGASSLTDLARAIGWLGKDGNTPEKMVTIR